MLLITGLVAVLAACGGSGSQTGDNYTSQITTSPSYYEQSDYRPNKVYESVELISLLMRLAGDMSEVFNQEFTEYQRSLMLTFGEFADHPAVEHTRHLIYSRGIGFDAPMWLALYMERVDDGFRLKEDAAFWYEDERWTQEIAEEFIPLINDFYIDSNFGEFFDANIPYFEEHTQRLIDELLIKINFDWFCQFGFSRDELRVTIYPSGSQGGFGPTIRGINYAVLPVTEYYGDFLAFVIHEFAHSFANPIADAWYEENEDFRRMSDDSVDLVRMWWYGTGLIMAREYVTRAYEILYLVENHDENILFLLLEQAAGGFPYIETVFAMITDHDLLLTPESDILTLVFGEGLEYILGEKQQVIISADRVYFKMVDLKGEELNLDDFDHNDNGNIYNTQKGDVLVKFVDGVGVEVMIDLGESPFGVEFGFAEGEFRKYSYITLDDENTIEQVLGVAYTLGEMQYFTFREEQVFYYQFMELLNKELRLSDFRHNSNGNTFSTQTGDIIIVTEDGRRFVYIDLGENGEWILPEGTMRKYSVFPLDIS